MSSDYDASDVTLPYEGKQRVHERTEKFIKAWKRFLESAGADGSRPDLSTFLGGSKGDERLVLLRELLDVDVHYRRKMGEQPTPQDYDGIPDAAQILARIFRSPASQQTDLPADHLLDIDKIKTRIGPYRLLSKLGEGGFGIVFLAEREQPFRQRVALKVIKPGMDTRQVIARFEAERQALAVMDHPNIAKVLDAGATANGRPYFVMELVHGEAMTSYCDRMKLTLDDRLELFIPICHAVHHAHQKGIIHRDLKPSNVLVAVVDDHPVAKVIDFGVAKAMAQPLTARTIFTEQGQLIGTPEYMSPEQAEMTGLDIDTRSDIYSLGVLLYELLTGALPFDRQTLREAGFDQIRRIIREVEPPKPSTRLSSLGDKSGSWPETGGRIPPHCDVDSVENWIGS